MDGGYKYSNSLPGVLPPGVRLDDDIEDQQQTMDMFVSKKTTEFLKDFIFCYSFLTYIFHIFRTLTNISSNNN